MGGGMLFGMLMGMMGMLPMIAKLVGSSSAVVGAIVHLVSSALIGAGFAFFFSRQANTLSGGVLWGGAYGVIWWVLGALIIMPIWLGMPAQLHLQGMKMAMPSLMGHMIYGITTGLIYSRLVVRKLVAATVQS
jgi:uncharacterized membrane protein YagU involved in acid resistance